MKKKEQRHLAAKWAKQNRSTSDCQKWANPTNDAKYLVCAKVEITSTAQRQDSINVDHFISTFAAVFFLPLLL